MKFTWYAQVDRIVDDLFPFYANRSHIANTS